MGRKWTILLIALFVAAAAVDAQRVPENQWGAGAMLAVVHAWQAVSPVLGLRFGCQYTPTCSVYGELAIRRFGAYRGGWLAAKRIWRCSPWAARPGEDWPR